MRVADAAALLLTALPLAACDSDVANGQRPAPAPSDRPRPAAPAATLPFPVSAPAVCGGGDAAVPTAPAIQALGRPASETRFTLSDPVSEFRVKLLNHFMLPRDAATRILEQTWSRGDCRLTIWSAASGGVWRPVERLNWSAGDEF